MIGFIEYLRLPAAIGMIIAAIFFIMQIIGGILDFRGKAVPAIMNIRRHFRRKRDEERETAETLRAVQALLLDVNAHYSADNIARRDSWIKWVNDRAETYDSFIREMGDKFTKVAEALNNNTKMAEEMFVQSSRDRIIDFASKAQNKDAMVSREEFNRIFKVYDKYEKFLREREMTNGEVDINYGIIKEAYEERLRGHTFTEDIRGYNN